MKEERFKRRLVEQVGLKPGMKVLDLGCGTATLTVMLKKACPGTEVVGLDVDEQALALGRHKVASSGVEADLVQGSVVEELPWEKGTFDRVVSSLMFHHLTRHQKRVAFRGAYELLGDTGELHVVDWGEPQNALMRLAFLGVRLLDGFETTRDNARGELIPLMEEAGFTRAAETHREMTLFGTLSMMRAHKET